MRTILGIEIHDRVKEAHIVQDLLTEYGCYIKTRLGLHEAGGSCSPAGLIIVEFVPDVSEKIVELEGKLIAIEGLKVRKMIFD